MTTWQLQTMDRIKRHSKRRHSNATWRNMTHSSCPRGRRSSLGLLGIRACSNVALHSPRESACYGKLSVIVVLAIGEII